MVFVQGRSCCRCAVAHMRPLVLSHGCTNQPLPALLSISLLFTVQKLLEVEVLLFFFSQCKNCPIRDAGLKKFHVVLKPMCHIEDGHLVDLDILAWPNPVLACLWGKFRSARESWIHKDLDLSEASALWGAMTNAKASEKCKTRMTGRWFWCLGGGYGERGWDSTLLPLGLGLFCFLVCP